MSEEVKRDARAIIGELRAELAGLKAYHREQAEVVRDQAAEIARLTAALEAARGEARREALEGAARRCDERARENFDSAARKPLMAELRQFAGEEAMGCAADIRASASGEG